MGHEISKNWRLQLPRYRLMGTKCENNHLNFPPREICPHCAEEAKTLYQYAGVFAKLVGIRVSSKADEKIRR